ncbi:MAG: ABC transporter ATP-binding protein [Candidatus Firestonebacteria bacterium]
MMETVNLTRKYGDFTAVNALNLKVKKGEIFGFLGPNGAGKTTTIKMFAGILIPTSGEAKIKGLSCHPERHEIMKFTGYLPDELAYYDYLKGSEILEFVARMHDISAAEAKTKAQALFERLALSDASEEYASNYSRGMKKKLGLACALIHSPEVIIMDEPTSGLDPIASREITGLIQELASKGVTIFLSTHLLNQAEKLCHRVGIIDQGILKAVGTVAELREVLAPGGSLEEVFFAVMDDQDEQVNEKH